MKRIAALALALLWAGAAHAANCPGDSTRSALPDTVKIGLGRVRFTSPAACADTVYTDSRSLWVQVPPP